MQKHFQFTQRWNDNNKKVVLKVDSNISNWKNTPNFHAFSILKKGFPKIVETLYHVKD
jgi:hypothetical protein